MKRWIWLVALMIVLVGCTKTDKPSNPNGFCKFESECDLEPANMSDYEGLADSKQFYSLTYAEFLEKVENKDTFVVYFGFAKCPWCVEALPILNEVAQEENVIIYYVDKKSEANLNDEQSLNTIETSILSQYLTKDDDGKPHLYVPDVFVFEEGNIKSNHLGTFDEHNAKERKMTDDEKGRLKGVYQNMIRG